MPSFSELLGPLLGFLFTCGTLLFIALSARWTAEREDLTGLDQPPPPTPSKDSSAPPPPVPPVEKA